MNSICFHRTVTLAMGSGTMGLGGGGQTGINDSSYLPLHILIFNTLFIRPKALSEAPYVACVGTVLCRQCAVAGAILSDCTEREV